MACIFFWEVATEVIQIHLEEPDTLVELLSCVRYLASDGYTCSIAGSLRMDALLGMVLKRHLAVDTVRLEILRLVDMLVQGKSAEKTGSFFMNSIAEETFPLKDVVGTITSTSPSRLEEIHHCCRILQPCTLAMEKAVLNSSGDMGDARNAVQVALLGLLSMFFPLMCSVKEDLSQAINHSLGCDIVAVLTTIVQSFHGTGSYQKSVLDLFMQDAAVMDLLTHTFRACDQDSCPEYVESLCALLRSLSQTEAVCLHILECGGFDMLSSLVMSGKTKKSFQAHRSVLGCLEHVTKRGGASSMDFYLRIIQDSEAKPDEIVVIACVHIVFGLNDIAGLKGSFYNCNGCATILSALRIPDRSTRFYGHLSMVLDSLAHEDAQSQRQLVEAGVVPILLDVVDANPLCGPARHVLCVCARRVVPRRVQAMEDDSLVDYLRRMPKHSYGEDMTTVETIRVSVLGREFSGKTTLVRNLLGQRKGLFSKAVRPVQWRTVGIDLHFSEPVKGRVPNEDALPHPDSLRSRHHQEMHKVLNQGSGSTSSSSSSGWSLDTSSVDMAYRPPRLGEKPAVRFHTVPVRWAFMDCGGHLIYSIFEEYFMNDPGVVYVVVLSALEFQEGPVAPQNGSVAVERRRGPFLRGDPYARMRAELLHWLTMLDCRLPDSFSILETSVYDFKSFKDRINVVVVFNFQGAEYFSPPNHGPEDPQPVGTWKYHMDTLVHMMADMHELFPRFRFHDMFSAAAGPVCLDLSHISDQTQDLRQYLADLSGMLVETLPLVPKHYVDNMKILSPVLERERMLTRQAVIRILSERSSHPSPGQQEQLQTLEYQLDYYTRTGRLLFLGSTAETPFEVVNLSWLLEHVIPQVLHHSGSLLYSIAAEQQGWLHSADLARALSEPQSEAEAIGHILLSLGLCHSFALPPSIQQVAQDAKKTGGHWWFFPSMLPSPPPGEEGDWWKNSPLKDSRQQWKYSGLRLQSKSSSLLPPSFFFRLAMVLYQHFPHAILTHSSVFVSLPLEPFTNGSSPSGPSLSSSLPGGERGGELCVMLSQVDSRYSQCIYVVERQPLNGEGGQGASVEERSLDRPLSSRQHTWSSLVRFLQVRDWVLGLVGELADQWYEGLHFSVCPLDAHSLESHQVDPKTLVLPTLNVGTLVRPPNSLAVGGEETEIAHPEALLSGDVFTAEAFWSALTAWQSALDAGRLHGLCLMHRQMHQQILDWRACCNSPGQTYPLREGVQAFLHLAERLRELLMRGVSLSGAPGHHRLLLLVQQRQDAEPREQVAAPLDTRTFERPVLARSMLQDLVVLGEQLEVTMSCGHTSELTQASGHCRGLLQVLSSWLIHGGTVGQVLGTDPSRGRSLHWSLGCTAENSLPQVAESWTLMQSLRECLSAIPPTIEFPVPQPQVHIASGLAQGTGSHSGGGGSRPGHPIIPGFQVAWDEVQLGLPLGDEGSFGVVYEAQWGGNPVAVKVFRQERYSPSAIRSFFQEAQTAIQARSPFIVQVFGVCDNPPAIIMERLDKSVWSKLREEETSGACITPWEERLAWALQAARGLEHLHKQQPVIVHADVKSLNFLLSPSGTLKITDFGLSEFRNETSLLLEAEGRLAPRAGQGGGTVPWSPPEVLNLKRPSPSSDVYSFGVFLWELVTTRIPFKGLSAGVITNTIRHLHPSDRHPLVEQLQSELADSLPPGMPDKYISLIEKCLRVQPESRPSMEKVRQTLERWTSTPVLPALPTETQGWVTPSSTPSPVMRTTFSPSRSPSPLSEATAAEDPRPLPL